MFLTATLKNAMLDLAIDESVSTGARFASLHSAYSTTGTNEISGGSPAYARKALTWAPASGGSKALAAPLPTFDVPGAGTVAAWYGLWDADTAGNFLSMMPLGSGALKRFLVPTGDLAADTIESPAHGFTNGQSVVVWAPSGLPTGISVGTIYYVVSATTDTLKLSATSGGSAIDLTAIGSGFLQLIVPATFGSQGSFAISSGSIDLSTVA